MKSIVKKLMSVIMAAAITTACTTALSVNAFAEGSETNISTDSNDEISPRYTKYKTISFDVTLQNYDMDSFTATDSTAELVYRSCTTGAATIEIRVNGSYQSKSIIPERSGAAITIPIRCSAGDTITYRVSPDSDAGYARAVGSFTIYY